MQDLTQAPKQPFPSRREEGGTLWMLCTQAPSISQRSLTETTSYFFQKPTWRKQKSLRAAAAAPPVLSAGQRQPESARLQVPQKHEPSSGELGSPAPAGPPSLARPQPPRRPP